MRETRHHSAARSTAVPTLAALALTTVLAVGCIGAGGPTPTPEPSGAATGSSEPSAAPTPVPTESTAPDPTAAETPASETPAPSEPVAGSESPAPAGSAADCSGSENNREFYASAAQALSFDVYCPVLPAGWFVEHGEYHLRNGGILQISYKGPSGRSLELVERGPCVEGDDCMPSGTEEGDVAFGSRPATIVALDDGRLAVVAEAVTDGSWWIIGSGLDEQALTEIAADLVLIGG
jgi:hypothetical protein